mmetsp:Transcript_29795/g.33229  ORF Transcript_29795/g.33229 Transcript_29795/m.33229 type:complete len:123 (-) Transcript_29795:24-392(-)
MKTVNYMSCTILSMVEKKVCTRVGMRLVNYGNSGTTTRTYIDSKQEGEYKQWYENGQLKEYCHYVNGIREGEYKCWYDNGQLETQSNYVNGLSEGEFMSWRKNGEAWYQCTYIKGVIHDITA